MVLRVHVRLRSQHGQRLLAVLGVQLLVEPAEPAALQLARKTVQQACLPPLAAGLERLRAIFCSADIDSVLCSDSGDGCEGAMDCQPTRSERSVELLRVGRCDAEPLCICTPPLERLLTRLLRGYGLREAESRPRR